MAEKENRLAQQGRRAKPGPYITKKKKQKDFFIVLDDTFMKDPDKIMEKIIITDPEKKAKGGRAGFKMGSGKCKLAKRGKGRAYGKNS